MVSFPFFVVLNQRGIFDRGLPLLLLLLFLILLLLFLFLLLLLPAAVFLVLLILFFHDESPPTAVSVGKIRDSIQKCVVKISYCTKCINKCKLIVQVYKFSFF